MSDVLLWRGDMKISTTTHIILPEGNMPFSEAVELIALAGFKNVDVSFSTEKASFEEEDWISRVEEMKRNCVDASLEPSVAHAYFVKSETEFEDYDMSRLQMHYERNILAAEMLGIPWIVVHPMNSSRLPFETMLEENWKLFSAFIPLLEKHHVGIAIENMRGNHFRKASELIQLVNALNSRCFGVCWDVGHANIGKQNQYESIGLLGDFLKVTHINDNFGGPVDLHILPYTGTVDWKSVLSALKEIRYQGCFDYEIVNYMKWYSPVFFPKMMQFAYELACYMTKEL